MNARFRAADCKIHWQGTDEDSPPGHSIATGTDAFGVPYLWLFRGCQPTDDTFVGSISIPVAPAQSAIAYGAGGGVVGTVTHTRQALEYLVDRLGTHRVPEKVHRP